VESDPVDMADFDDDYDDGYYYDDDYVYVDDSFDLADELAENAIPEPPLVDRKEEDWDDFDSYDYWMDIEYNTDEYYDTLLQKSDQESHQNASGKRKGQDTNVSMPAKRRKVSAVQSRSVENENGIHEITPVIWLSFQETHPLCDKVQPYEGRKSAPCTLFSDWKERFKDSAGFSTAPQVTGVMISKSGDEGLYEEMDDNEMDDDNEDNDQEESDDGEDDPGLDQQQLMSVLQEKLSGASMGPAQQAKFMETIMSALAKGGGEGLEGILEELTDSILNEAADEGSDSGAAKWLSQQGVNLGEEEDNQQDEETQADIKDTGTLETGPTTSTMNSQNGHSHHDITQADQVVLEDVEAAEKPEAVEGKELKTHDVESSTTANTADKSARKEKATIIKSTRSKAGKQENLPKSSTTKPAGKAQPASRKRKVDVDEPVPAETKPKRQARNFAAPTAASSNKNVETTKRTTRSARQNKK